jgi:DNA-binding NarL/FixJ family response regulator
MIRIATMDCHPTVLAGVEAILRDRPGLVHAGSASDRYGLWPLLQRTHLDVVLLEHSPGGDGLELCLRLKERDLAPRVVLHCDGAEALVAASFAGADAVLDKAAPVRELVGTLRSVAAGEHVMPPASLPLRSRAAERLGAADRAIFAMRMAGTSSPDIASVAGVRRSELHGRLASIAAQLAGHTVPAPDRHLRAVA